MRKIVFLAIVGVALFGVTAMAQQNTVTSLLDSPVKMDQGVYNAGETIVCSVALPGTAALFGGDTVNEAAATKNFLIDELFGTFRVWNVDENCTIQSTWSTAFGGSTMTGIAIGNNVFTAYWTVNPAGTADQYSIGTGASTGLSFPLPTGGLLGAAVVDSNSAGNPFCVDDIALDSYTCVDANSGGAFICSYASADNTGSGAFGNGMGDAETPGDCSGATLVQSSGTINEGQVTRVGQYDCAILDPACSDRWDVSTFSTFVNGIEETDIAGSRHLLVVDNVTSNVLIINQPIGITDCQDIDANMDLVYVNASQGGIDFNVNVNTAATLSVGEQKTASGNGKFVHHMNAGAPDGTTVGSLFDLGNNCFPFLGGSPVVVENNVGKTNLVGSSNYFGAAVSNPSKAPTFLGSLLQASIDTANMPVGSVFTHQAIHLNAAASSAKGGSLSNALTMTMQ
jgi:hypothetical protein